MLILQGVPKNALKIVWIISLATDMLEGDFLCHVSGSKSFLYNIREPKYKKKTVQVWEMKFQDIRLSNI